MTTKIKSFVLVALLSPFSLKAQQLITMSNKCYKQVQAGNQQNDQGQYQEALNTFTKVLKDCSAKDAKEEGNVGKAIAFNGLKQYNDAITAAESAIKVSKQTNVMAYYARSYALNQAGMRQLTQGFDQLGLAYIPSYANFISFKVADAALVNQQLLKNGVIVRPVANYEMPDYLRVSIGLFSENARFLAVLEQIVKND